MNEGKLKDAASATPDPERALKNLTSFLAENPSRGDELEIHVRGISLLFSFSQFLANYSIARPDILFSVLQDIDTPLDREHISAALKARFDDIEGPGHRVASSGSPDLWMEAVREFRMQEMLRITLRDILRKTDLVGSMAELSVLADVVIANSLVVVRRSLTEIYGAPADNAFAVIALGKLGGEELNYSSDVDIIFVYGTEIGETSGVSSARSGWTNRITNHEYYCKLGEGLTRFLSLNTGAGFAYRVDLRLRPEGQKGAIALALRGYEMYYESWGRAWERAMLIRARHVAGDAALGKNFIDMIRPFVYRKYLDYSSIDEIRRLKMRIDSTFKKGDIKRGYGGIREIEFFVQALQLIYGGREPLLRERSILKTLHLLLQKSLVGQEDSSVLSENYRHLRTLEHRLQQMSDLQTHTLPSGKTEIDALGRKMGFGGGALFLQDLEKRRKSVRAIYDSLFSEKKEQLPLAGTLFDEDLSDAELKEQLSGAGLVDVSRAARNIRAIRDSTLNFQTLRGRRLLGDILPAFIDAALRSSAPDTALNHLQSFAALLGANESYLEIFSREKRLISRLTYLFSQSEYLSKMLMGRPRYLEMIGWEESAKKSVHRLCSEIQASVSGGYSLNDAVRLIKQAEEIRLGLLFLQKKIGAADVVRGLGRTAEAVLQSCMGQLGNGADDLAAVGFGKLGGREITFGSDLDIIFVSSGEVTQEATKAAERFLRMLISYTREGIAYRVDTRLRPEGSKGPLVSAVESFRKYYAGAAAFWEFQALLKARPVCGNAQTGKRFLEMAKDVLTARGAEVSASDINAMRERIMRELSRESDGYDIKLGPGGIEEIEFTVQYLQLKNCGRERSLLVQGTVTALERLKGRGIMGKQEVDFLKEVYLFYRTLESFLRLRGEQVLSRQEDTLRNAAEFLGFKEAGSLVKSLERKRRRTKDITARHLG
jgi:glutamate-ammonia-ligase adenylyltransferase